MLRRDTTSGWREQAFTMMELVVAMVLLAVVMGGLVYAITQLGRGNSEAMTDRKAQREAIDAMEQLRADVRAARSPALEEWDGRRETLRDIVYFGIDQTAGGPPDPAHAACGNTPFLNCVRDITKATDTELWFRADVRTGAGWNGTECIGYRRDAKGLVRYESPNWQACGQSVTGTATRLVAADNVPTQLFTYTLRYHPTMVRGQVADPDGCQTYSNQRNLTAGQLNLVNAVDIDLRGIANERGTAATTGLQTSVPITGRTTGDYAYAMGCSY